MKIIYESKEEPLVEVVENGISWDMKLQHYHNTMEIYLLTEGDRQLTINNQTFILNSGDLAIIKPYALHYSSAHTSERMTRYIISISEEMLSAFLDKYEVERLFSSMKSHIISLEKEQIELLVKYWECAKEYYKSADTLKMKIGKFYVIQIMMIISELKGKNERIVDSPSGLDEEMIDIIKFIHKKYKEPDFNLHTVLDYSHMSKSKFCKLFKETFRITFLRYVHLLRIIAIKEALRESDKSIEVISEEYGFVSLQTMIRNFVSEFGVSPAKYRRGIRNNGKNE